ncbi:energy transducer TonB [Xanthomarina sp.]|uniref:energy transducer TonB n=1 Tax=Xanthomarina sp. TaxID=1931211 RepID=UPI002BAFFE38|nr:energy transducer TonB [Xanthomarina sp.]HLV38756.1 energy transducer TonB [Xanthomarina sp.]
MTFSKNNSEANQKNDQKPLKPQKQDTKLKTNSTVYFQVGLIVCLLVSFFLLEASFQTLEVHVPDVPELPIDEMYAYNAPITIYKEPIQVEQNKKKPVLFNEPIIKNNDAFIEPTDVVVEATPTEIPLNPGNITVIEIPEEAPPMNIMVVEQVPIFPGCEDATSNEARRQCMSNKIATHIQRSFNTNVASNLGLNGEQKIYVTFKIDKTGHVTNIKTSSKYSQLDKESVRVMEKLPQMTPAKQKDKNVEVLYSLPINFNIIN